MARYRHQVDWPDEQQHTEGLSDRCIPTIAETQGLARRK